MFSEDHRLSRSDSGPGKTLKRGLISYRYWKQDRMFWVDTAGTGISPVWFGAAMFHSSIHTI